MRDEKDNWDLLPAVLRDDFTVQVFRDLSRSEEHPRGLVLITHGFIELLVNALIDAKTKSKRKNYPYSTKLVILYELEVISGDQYRTLNVFRNIRNRAAHDAIFAISNSDLAQLKDTGARSPESFHTFCVDLIAGFWNQYIEVFGPIFSPGATGLAGKTSKGKKQGKNRERS